MKKILILTITFLILSFSAEAVEWESFDQAFSEARLNSGKTMLYFKTSWCHYCKKMEESTFSDESVKKEMNQFHAVQIDIESSKKMNSRGQTGRELGAVFGVRGTPAIWFFDDAGKPITSIPGYIPPEMFVKVLRYIGSDAYKSVAWDEWNRENK